MVAASGRRAPGGGIMPARSLRIIFSATSGCSAIFAASKPASTSSPAFMLSLWHAAQFCATSLFCASMDDAKTAAADAGLVEGPASVAGLSDASDSAPGAGVCART